MGPFREARRPTARPMSPREPASPGHGRRRIGARIVSAPRSPSPPPESPPESPGIPAPEPVPRDPPSPDRGADGSDPRPRHDRGPSGRPPCGPRPHGGSWSVPDRSAGTRPARDRSPPSHGRTAPRGRSTRRIRISRSPRRILGFPPRPAATRSPVRQGHDGSLPDDPVPPPTRPRRRPEPPSGSRSLPIASGDARLAWTTRASARIRSGRRKAHGRRWRARVDLGHPRRARRQERA